jgi:FG-GAP repeat
MEARSAGAVKLGPAGSPRSARALAANARRLPRFQTLGSWPLLLAAALLALAVGAAAHESLPGRRSVDAAHVRAHRFSRAGLQSLPLAAQGPVSAALGAEGQAYRVSRLGGRFTASSPVQHLSTSFTRVGVSVRSGTTKVGLSLLAVGYGSTLAPLAQVAPSAHANRVLYRHPGLDEWYTNGPLGLEQGFTVPRAPSGRRDGPLTLSMLLSSNVKAALAQDGQSIVIGRAGRALLRYTGLLATDAGGRALHSWLELAGGRLLLRVDAAGVRYPLRIDPLIQQGEKLTGMGETGTGRFGYSVALSADGSTALIGGRYYNSAAGGAWVFTRSGSTWTQQGGKLVGTGHTGVGEFDHVGEGEFGASVALSADGSTALIGAPADNGNPGVIGGLGGSYKGTGGAWVFTRSGSTWAQQGEKLTGTGETGEGGFGTSVALSADGDTALIGGPADDGGAGAAWAFTRTGAAWTQQGGKLTGGGETGGGEFGSSVALSEHGDTALIGGPHDNGSAGAAWAFTRTGAAWTQQGGKLTGGGETGGGEFGSSVTLSADGDTALIGGRGDDGGAGAAWVFTRSGAAWTQQGEKLTGGGETGGGEFGSSVALSADASTVLIGGPGDNGGAGAAWVFTRSGAAWTQQGEKLTGGGETGEGNFGASVALSEDGDTALIGGPGDNGATGATWVFTRTGGVWGQQGRKLTGGEEGNGEFGVIVALSADGNTALVGGWYDNSQQGAVWVFTRTGGVWSQQGPKLTGGGETEGGGFGTSVALSADGDTALIGGPGDNGEKGAAWVFTRSGSTWAQQGEKLTGGGETGNAWFGYTVALSGDGNTALIGGWLDNNWKGAAWVFTRSGSTWAQQGEKLTGAGETEGGMFGTNVALSADGDTALIGGWNDENVLAGYKDYSGKGAAWVFTRSGSAWTQQGPKLTGGGEAGEGKFGTIVALSADGDTALIGGWNDDHSKGAAWVFTRTGSTWAQQGEKLTGGGETGEGRFGVSVALSADGDTALIGGLDDNGARGAVWLFTRTGATWTQQGEKLTGGGEAGEGEFGTNVALSADGDTALVGAWRDNGGTGAAWVFVDPPSATTGAATGVGEAGATLNGTLAAGGSSTAYFQYGTTAAYGASTATQSVNPFSSPGSVAASIDGLAPGTTYHFRLVAENSAGVAYSGDQTFTTEAHGATSTTGVLTTPPTQNRTSTSPPAPSQTALPPTVQYARQSTTRWREGDRLARISRATTPTGTTFSFSLDEQAAVTFGFAQRVSGREAGGECVAQTEKNRGKPACGRTVTAGGLAFTGHIGTDEVAFQGRISPVKKLAPGRYTLAITATNSAGVRSAPKSLSFTIVK